MGYEAGDVVSHSSRVVYMLAATIRMRSLAIRLSTDWTIYSQKDSDEGRTDDRRMKAWGVRVKEPG